MRTADDVAALLGTTYAKLGKQFYRWHPTFLYRTFDVAKKTGGTRRIAAPRKWLKEHQQVIADILLELYPGHPAVHGFVKDRSIVTNASSHLNKRFVFNIDIENFFGCVNFGRVRGVFSSKFFNLPKPVATVLAQLCCFNGALPQGAPSSPIITNYIALHMDRQLRSLAKSNRCTYSRYADDITFSFTSPRKKLPESILQQSSGTVSPGTDLSRIVNANGFTINSKKTRLNSRSQRQDVTGIVVNEGLNVPRQMIRQTRSMLYAWKTHGLAAAENEYHAKYCTKHRASSKLTKFDQVIRGRLNFIRSVRGDRDVIFVGLAKSFNRLASKNGIASVSFVEPMSTVTKFENAVVVVEYAYDGDDGTPVCGQGTAFFINDIGWVTCEHVVCDVSGSHHKDIEAFWSNDLSAKYSVKVLKSDPHRDVAVIQIHESNGTVVTPQVPMTGSATFKKGQKVTIAGFPSYTPGQPAYVTDCTIGTAYPKSGVAVFEPTTHLAGGISGGPVIDMNDNVVGMVTKGAIDGAGSDLAVAFCEILAVSNS